jgi:oligoribonuclease NrnB/cAMP/cGMP phosphodiesterase (DHH superfamily)
MTEEEMIKKIADPILKQLEKIEKNYGADKLTQVPQIKFVYDKQAIQDPVMIGDIEITTELLEKVEAYIQDEIENTHAPTILN